MGFFSRVENKMEDTIEGAADRMISAPISPVQIAKQCEKQMKRNKMVGAGKQIAPTLYTVLVNEDDDRRLFGYYPTLAGETETYLVARAHETGLSLDGNPLVRFIADPALKHGKFDVIAECVASPIISRLRDEEMARYGFDSPAQGGRGQWQAPQASYGNQAYGAYGEDSYDSYNNYDNYNAYTTRDANNGAGAYNNYDNGYDEYDSYDPNNYTPNADYGEVGPFSLDDENDMWGDAQSGQGAQGAGDFSGFDVDTSDAGMGAGAGAGAAAAAGAGAAGAGAAAAAAGAAAGAAGAAAGAGAAGAAAGAAGAAAAQRRAMNLPQAQPLCATLTERTTGKSFTLSASNVKLGRETDNDIVIADMGASRYHASIQRGQDCWVLTDQNSTNGTLVNGREVNRVALRNGDTITIGTSDYIFAQA